MEIALEKLRIGAFNEALEAIKGVESVDAAIARGQALVGLKRWEEAAAELEKASKICADNGAKAAQETLKQEQEQARSNKQVSEPVIEDVSPLPRPKFDWYQSTDEVFITITARKLSKDDVKLSFASDKTAFDISLAGKHRLQIKTFALIEPEKSSFSLTEYKVELKIAKAVPGNWLQLESSKDQPPQQQQVLPAPYASKKSPTDWTKLEKEADEEEDGDALNRLLKKIYKDADEDTRRAMIKSYQTSGGTVLTTNWNEAAEKDFSKEIKPPKGQVFKSWDGDVIAKDDEDDD